MVRIRIAVFLVALILASVSLAEWSSDPTVNISVADGAGDQVQPKIAPTSDGGCYLSWFDALGNGYDVRVQKLDSQGNEVLAHNGVLVADRSFSSTQDYGLDVDASGNALLAFRDDRPGGVQITAAKVSPAGMMLWGAAGIQLTNTSAYVAAPKIAGTSDGGAVVAWTQDADVHLQKLAVDGSVVWGMDVILVPAVGSYTASDLHGTGTDVILSVVHVTGTFTAPKHLLAQKFDASGTALWPGLVAVFDSGSLQFGNYPSFVPDGTGGAVFSWYDAGTLQFQCYAQHLLADGSEAFPHNGSAASTNATRVRVSPWAAFNPSTSETFLFWEEENSAQSQTGVYGQKFDAAGNRQWTGNGAAVVPVGTDENTQVRCLSEGAGAFVFWVQAPAFAQDRVYGAHLDGDGTIDISRFDVASTVSDKSRLAIGRSTSGFAILAWQDSRVDEYDILAQNVNSDGSLGNPQTGIGEDFGIPTVALGTPWPNPMSSTTQFAFTLASPHGGLLAAYDVRGRVVRKFLVNPGTQQGMVTWDGRDDRGERVPGGVYFLRLQDGDTVRQLRVTVLR